MLMSDDLDSMFDIDCLVREEDRRLVHDHWVSPDSPKETTSPDPIFGRTSGHSRERQDSLDDIAHVISHEDLDKTSLLDGADTIQDLAQYLKDDGHSEEPAHLHNYASRMTPPPIQVRPKPYVSQIQVKQERPETPTEELDAYRLPQPRRKRFFPIVYKEEPLDEGYGQQERDANLPPPRKYIRKSPKSIKDLDEYRKRRERNNEAVRRARAKKRQNEALIHSENRALKAEASKLYADLEKANLRIETQDRVIAQLKGQLARTAKRCNKRDH